MTTEKIWRVPMPTKEIVMKDKNFNYNILAKTMLESNRNQDSKELFRDAEKRYIYKNKFVPNVKDYFLEGDFSMSKKTFEKHWRYIRKVDFDIVRAENSYNGIVYKLNYKDSDGRKFVEVPSDILQKLIECTNLNVLKIYLVLLYTCNKEEYKPVNRAWLCSKIGFSEKSLGRMTIILDFLENDLNLIEINRNVALEYINNGVESIKTTNSIKLK